MQPQGVDPIGAAVDHHHHDALLVQLDQQRMVDPRGGDDQAFHLPGQQRIHQALFADLIVVGVDHERAVAGRLQRPFDAPQDGREQGLVRSGISTPMVPDLAVLSPRAMGLGR